MKKKYKALVCCDKCNDHFEIHTGTPKVGLFIMTYCSECKSPQSAWVYGISEKEGELKVDNKKEKRWIAYSSNQKRLGALSFDSEQDVRAHYIHEVDEPQFIEIEVEV